MLIRAFFFFFFTVGALCLIPTKCKGFFKESLTPKEGQHLLRPFSLLPVVLSYLPDLSVRVTPHVGTHFYPDSAIGNVLHR